MSPPHIQASHCTYGWYHGISPQTTKSPHCRADTLLVCHTLNMWSTYPHLVQYHTSWDIHYICGRLGHTWCSTTLPHGRVWPQRPIVDTVIIITWVSEQDDRTSLAHSTDLVSDDWITFGQCSKTVTQILYGIRYHKRARAHSPLVDRARGDKRLRPWWQIGGGGEGDPCNQGCLTTARYYSAAGKIPQVIYIWCSPAASFFFL